MILPLKTDRIRTIKVGWVVYGCGGAIQKNVVLEIERLLTAGYTIPEAVQCADVGDRCTGLVCYPADPAGWPAGVSRKPRRTGVVHD